MRKEQVKQNQDEEERINITLQIIKDDIEALTSIRKSKRTPAYYYKKEELDKFKEMWQDKGYRLEQIIIKEVKDNGSFLCWKVSRVE